MAWLRGQLSRHSNVWHNFFNLWLVNDGPLFETIIVVANICHKTLTVASVEVDGT